MIKRACITQEDAARLSQYLVGLPLPFSVSIGEGLTRSLSQNALFHIWMGQIAKATSDTEDSVKADCHIQWGIPIFRGADEDYSEFIAASLGGRTRAKVHDMICKGYIPCTRIMTPLILSKYMDAIWREYSPSVHLKDPKSRKYEAAA